MKKKIFITGGHVTPALAVIEKLESDPKLEIVFIGRKYAMERDTQPSAEYMLIREKGIKFLELITGRLQRRLTTSTVPSLLKIPIGFVQSFVYLVFERPDVVVSFGGYVAVPVALCAWALGIPVLTHEQTLAPGIANTLIARVAKIICVTHEETAKKFRHHHVVVTGLPIRESLFATVPSKSPFSVQLKSYPLLYITGGSLGAQSLNALIFPLIPELVKRFTVIHQVGQTSYEQAVNTQIALSAGKSRYHIAAYISGDEYLWVLEKAGMVLARAGANTTMELALKGKVVLFVPLPWSGGNEQYLNAKWLEANGGARILNQQTLTSQDLLHAIDALWQEHDIVQKKASLFASKVPHDGAENVVQKIRSLL